MHNNNRTIGGWTGRASLFGAHMFFARRPSVVLQATHRAISAMIENLESRRLLSAGDLDTTFGNGGKVLNLANIDVRADVNDTAIQADSRIVASVALLQESAFGVRRYFNNGTLDTSFGTAGTAVIDLPKGPISENVALGVTVAMQSDGKILVGGRSNDQFTLIRLTSSGKLDTTFSNDGIVTTDFGTGGFSDGIHDIVVQPDGKIVAVGESNGVIAIARYTTSGNLDTTFDGDGKVLTNTSGHGEHMNAVALQSDGKIIAAGAASPDGLRLMVARYTTSGQLDTTFDGDGMRITSLGGELGSVALQADGRIVASSTSRVIRLNSNGSSDNGFGSSGVFTPPAFSGGSDLITGIGIRSDGKIVLGGSQRYFSGTYSQGVLLRLNSNGTLDSTYGTSGKKLFNIYQPTSVDSFQLLSDGRILVGGETYQDLPYLARFTSASNAPFETSFGIGGKAVVNLTTRAGVFTSAKIQSDGKIVALGYSQNIATGSQDVYLARFNTDGTVDTAFGTNGAVLIDNLLGPDRGLDLALAPSGKIVILANVSTDAIHTQDPSTSAYLIARFNSNGTPDSTFGTNGRVIREDIPNDQGQLGSLAVQSDGKIILGELNSTIRRLNLNGTLDTTFATNGIAQIEEGNFTNISNLRVAVDNSIFYLAGSSFIGHLNANGTPDTSFAHDGSFEFSGYNFDAFENAPNGNMYVLADNGVGRTNRYLFRVFSGDPQDLISIPGGHALAVDGSSRILVVDRFDEPVQGPDNRLDIVLHRYEPDLTIDSDFGDNGTVQTNIAYFEFANGAAIAPSGRIIAFGNASQPDSISSSPLLLAYQGDTGNTPPPPETGSVSGFAFNDTNTNGQFDTGETKTGGKTIFLDTNGNNALDVGERSVVTDDSGNYTFGNLNAGTYHIRRVFPAGYGYSTAPIDVTLGAGQDLANLAIGSKPITAPPPQTGTLVGFTFDDNNLNGQFDAGDGKTSGKTVFLDTNNNNLLDSGEQSMVTDINGDFRFANLPAGTYHVRRVFPDGWTYSTTAIDLTLSAGQTITNLAIGSRQGTTAPPPTPTSISGFTFDDTDVDGVYDVGDENKTSGKTVFLDANNNGHLDSGERSVVTDQSGSFTFNNLSAGTYHVRRVFPSGWTYSTAPIDITLSNGESAAGLAIGSKPITQTTGIIRGFTFNDTNENGHYDAGEQKTGGKLVYLDTNNNRFPDFNEMQVLTDSDGSFSFTGLAAGTYRVRREFPRGYTYSTPLIDVDLQAGEIFTNAAIGSKPTA
jgi:uncharacterized delta-60 repeat protein